LRYLICFAVAALAGVVPAAAQVTGNSADADRRLRE
jgi:hypothetical protein